ncbi:MAG: LPS assembly lipoprotein LptE [Legionella sp.]|jgi:LPS-assembly lipoprotein
MKRAFIPLSLILLLSACGFHLRGMIDIPRWLNNVAIISPSPNPAFVTRLQRQLEAYKIDVNPDPGQADYWIILNRIEFRQQIVSIGSSTNPRQYQLSLLVGFTVQKRNGKVLQAEKQVQVSRQFTSNNDRILGSDSEESIIVNEMRQDAVIQVLNRLEFIHNAD